MMKKIIKKKVFSGSSAKYYGSHFVFGEIFFGVFCNLLGVRGLDTGVVLGAILIFLGVVNRLGDCDVLADPRLFLKRN